MLGNQIFLGEAHKMAPNYTIHFPYVIPQVIRAMQSGLQKPSTYYLTS